jgi:hypothetical protein
MSRLQELHPDQQAVLQLVLRRRMPYSDLAGMLGLTPEGVRERALDAIDGLAPDDVEGLALEDRDRIADHLLGQDEGADREATATLIREHAPAGAWAATVSEELAPLGGPAAPESSADPVAATPDAEPAAAEPSVAGPATEAPAYQPPADGPLVHGAPLAASAANPDPPKTTPSGRRNPLAGRPPAVLAGAGAGVLVLVLLVLWVGGAFGGDDNGGESESAASPATTSSTTATAPGAAPTAEERAAAAQFVAALPQTIRMRPPASATGAFARVTGTAKPAISQASAATPVLSLTMSGLPAVSAKRRYFAWADKNGADPIFLGQLTDVRGAELPFQGLDLKTRQATVVDPTVYSRVRVTLETDEAPTRPGRTVLVGTITPQT